MQQVELIASGYEWECPECEILNKETEITYYVTCKNCKTKFIVSDYFHAHDK